MEIKKSVARILVAYPLLLLICSSLMMLFDSSTAAIYFVVDLVVFGAFIYFIKDISDGYKWSIKVAYIVCFLILIFSAWRTYINGQSLVQREHIIDAFFNYYIPKENIGYFLLLLARSVLSLFAGMILLFSEPVLFEEK